MKKQKFFAGDRVRVADDLGPSRRHFRAGGEALVEYSYYDKYGGSGSGRDKQTFSLLLMPEMASCSWYYEDDLTLIERLGPQALHDAEEAREARDNIEGQLSWIVAHWPEIQDRVPSASMDTLFELLGVDNPWGPNGEGMTYHANAMATLAWFKDALESGSEAAVRARADEGRSVLGRG